MMRALSRLMLPFLLLTCMSGLAVFCPGLTFTESYNEPLSRAPAEVQAAYNQIVEAFSLYNTFLESDYRPDGTCVLLHARDLNQAYAFLACGFTSDMSRRICEAYTIWNPNRQELLLIPQDGLPVLNDEDRPYVVFSQIQPDYINFVCIYTNCYSPGDTYRYSIAAHLEDGRWKIKDLSLDPISREGAQNQPMMYANQKS